MDIQGSAVDHTGRGDNGGMPTTLGTAPETPYDAGPVAALRRIAFLLERSRAETYKVKAFRAAAATILPLDPDEVAARAAARTLRELPGIGSSTAEVIEAAALGRTPARLARLEALRADPRLAGHYRLTAARAHLLDLSGDVQGALEDYRAAAARTTSVPERDYLLARAARLADTPSRGGTHTS